MPTLVCEKGHTFEKTSSCPVCPICSSQEMKEKFSKEFPKLGAPAFRALDNIGIATLAQLTKYSEAELLTLHGFGPRALRLLKASLKEQGLSLAGKMPS